MVKETIEVRILSLYAQGRLFESYSISEIARTIGAGYPHVHTAITQMQTRGLLKTKQYGRTIFCTPNLTNEYARNLLAQASIKQKNELLQEQQTKNLHTKAQQLCTQDPSITAAIILDKELTLIATNKELVTNTKILTPQEFVTTIYQQPDLFSQTTILHGQENIYFYLQQVQPKTEVVV